MKTAGIITVTLVGLIFVAGVLGFIVGGTVGGTTEISIDTVAVTSTNTFVRLVTSTTTANLPSEITVRGNISSLTLLPVELDLNRCFGELRNQSLQTCIQVYAFPITLVSTSNETVNNRTYVDYHGSYSFVVKNNVTYYETLTLRDSVDENQSYYIGYVIPISLQPMIEEPLITCFYPTFYSNSTVDGYYCNANPFVVA